MDLRHSQHDPLLPTLLDRVCPETIDQINEQKRSEDRQVIIIVPNSSNGINNLINFQDGLFPLYTSPNSSDDQWQEITPAPEPSHPFSHRLLIKCLQLKLDLEVEPIFAILALYDAKEKKKVNIVFFPSNPLNYTCISHRYQKISTWT